MDPIQGSALDIRTVAVMSWIEKLRRYKNRYLVPLTELLGRSLCATRGDGRYDPESYEIESIR